MSFNAASGLSAGIQGAKLGGALGGPWGAVGGGLLGLVLGGAAKDQENHHLQHTTYTVRYILHSVVTLIPSITCISKH